MSVGGLKCSHPPSAKVCAEEDHNSFITTITSKLNNIMHAIAAPLPPPPPPPITNPLIDAAMDYINNMLQLSTDNWINIGNYFLKHQELAKQIWVQCWLMKYWDGQK
ncbi:hypothetical protein M404DRAFT_24404 [Pisolithus tinctorius Marx 270]|uniref:Uncharacterized protein n=1 Tax=Pisolithus tinctorius Marx 270 TaxID=870435 RepID=A0A0C3KAS6_PISTI|nr:hypothetical protein M404DRAFT_24404 [Pisolithus tinctorius Marx 270]